MPSARAALAGAGNAWHGIGGFTGDAGSAPIGTAGSAGAGGAIGSYSCFYNGQGYAVGQIFYPDSVNICICYATAAFACTGK